MPIPASTFRGLIGIAKRADHIGVDLDATLAHYNGWRGIDHIGTPVPKMVARVKRWLKEGKDVRIFTARASSGRKAVRYVKDWCKEHLGRVLPVTNVKDPHMVAIWDDRAHRVEKNTGEKKASDYAPGLPVKGNYGDPLTGLKPQNVVDFVLQHHATKRNPSRPHYDLRLGTPATGMYSWALPKAHMPEPGERVLAAQTEIHKPSYSSFQGEIGKGYGAGTVTTADLGKAIITKTTPNVVHFTLGHTKSPKRYSLINTANGRNGRNWLLLGRGVPSTIPGVGDKPVYAELKAEDLDDALRQATQVQAKIDGASGVINIDDKGTVEAASVRPRVTGEPVLHTERLGLGGSQHPDLADSTFRGEMYFKDPTGKALPFKDVSGLLNMHPAKSLESQQARKLTPAVAGFDVIRYRGKPVSELSEAERVEALRTFAEQVKHVELPRTVPPSEAKQLIEDIREGRVPETEEGVVIRTQDGKVLKFKNKQEATGYLTGVFQGEGRREGTAGGLTYSNEAGGESTGRVGTGFSDAELKDIVTNLNSYIGRPMRIEHMGQFESGKHRAPSFRGFETDKAADSVETPAGKGYDSTGNHLRIERMDKQAAIKEAIIQARGKGFVLMSHKGKVLGHHASRASALRQERAIQINKHAASALEQYPPTPSKVAIPEQGVPSSGIAPKPGFLDRFASPPADMAPADMKPFARANMTAAANDVVKQVLPKGLQRVLQNVTGDARLKTVGGKPGGEFMFGMKKQFSANPFKPRPVHVQAARLANDTEALKAMNLSSQKSRARNKAAARELVNRRWREILRNPEQRANHEAGTKQSSAPSAVEVAQAARVTDKTPTKGQKETGNYRKGRVTVHGLQIAIENPKGSYRSGTSKAGKSWRTLMTAHYGYFVKLHGDKVQEGKDGDAPDVFIGPDLKSYWVFVVNQVSPSTGKLDEHKVVLGCHTAKEAKALYLSNYAKGWKGCGSIKTMLIPQFKRWLASGDLTKRAAVPILDPMVLRLYQDLRHRVPGNSVGGVVGKVERTIGRKLNNTLPRHAHTVFAKSMKDEPVGTLLGTTAGLLTPVPGAGPVVGTRVKRTYVAIRDALMKKAFEIPSAVTMVADDVPMAIYRWFHNKRNPNSSTLPEESPVPPMPSSPWLARLPMQPERHVKDASVNYAYCGPIKVHTVLSAGCIAQLKSASTLPRVTVHFSSPEGTVKASAVVEVADTPESQRRGLMFRSELPDNQGMFFSKAGSYWMKNVSFPLDIMFVTHDGTVLEKQSMVPVEGIEAPLYTPTTPADHAIELPAGWCDRNDVKPGDRMTIGTL